MRLFTAVDIPADIRARLATLLDELRPLAKLQWSTPEKLHITTTFIGEWREERLDELLGALARVHGDPVAISISGLRWMNRRVLCAGVEAGPELATLAFSTSAALASIGVTLEDREYHPHLTLARRKHTKPPLRLDQTVGELRASGLGTFTATKFALFLSHGGKYTQIKEFLFSK